MKHNPFKVTAQNDKMSHLFFICRSTEDHLAAMTAGTIGKSLLDFAQQKKVHVHRQDLPGDMLACYEPPSAQFEQGRILYENEANASLLGHEHRHAWQVLGLPWDIQQPDSPEGEILFRRFMEADARAVEFGVTLQTAHHMRVEHAYVFYLITLMDKHQKEYCGYSIKQMDEIASSPAKLKKAMRYMFDFWMAVSPGQPGYEQSLETRLSLVRDEGQLSLRDRFKTSLGLRIPGRVYTRDHLDPAYPRRLAEAVGVMSCDGTGGNYLTETDGPDFNSPLYTRICNYELERQVERIHQLRPVS